MGLVAVLTKIHHAVIDGFWGRRSWGSCSTSRPRGARCRRRRSDDVGDPSPTPADARARAAGRAGYPLRCCARCRRRCRTSRTRRSASSRGWARSRAWRACCAATASSGDLTAPKTLFSGRDLAAPAVRVRPALAGDVKAVKNAHGTTVNDVVVSICAGAVRRWLIEHDDLPDVPLVAQVPVSVRTGEEFGTYGNRILLMAAPLFTDIRTRSSAWRDPRSAAGDEGAPRALPAALLQDANHFIPPAVFARAARLTFGLDHPPGPADLEPRHLQRPRAAVPAVHGGRAAGGELPGVRDHRRHGAEHHGDELHGPHGLRDRRRPRPDARRGPADGVPARGAGCARCENLRGRRGRASPATCATARPTPATCISNACSAPSTR